MIQWEYRLGLEITLVHRMTQPHPALLGAAISEVNPDGEGFSFFLCLSCSPSLCYSAFETDKIILKQ